MGHRVFYDAIMRWVKHDGHEYWAVPISRVFNMFGRDANEAFRPVRIADLSRQRFKYLQGKVPEDKWKENVFKHYACAEQRQNMIDLQQGLNTVLSEVIEKLYAGVVQMNEQIKRVSNGPSINKQLQFCDFVNKKQMVLDEYQKRIETIRLTFLDYFVKANMHMRTSDFDVYGDGWLLVSYNRHLRVTKGK